jgi:hypothetical protein
MLRIFLRKIATFCQTIFSTRLEVGFYHYFYDYFFQKRISFNFKCLSLFREQEFTGPGVIPVQVDEEGHDRALGQTVPHTQDLEQRKRERDRCLGRLLLPRVCDRLEQHVCHAQQSSESSPPRSISPAYICTQRNKQLQQ